MLLPRRTLVGALLALAGLALAGPSREAALAVAPGSPAPGKTLGTQEPGHGGYTRALEAYRDCRDEEATRILASVPADYLLSLARADRHLLPIDGERRLAAALLLHTRLFLERPQGQQLEHRLMASHVSERLLTSGASTDVGELAYALLAVQIQEEGDVRRLVELLARLPPSYRRAPRALLASASIHELLSTAMVSLPPFVGPVDGPLAGMPFPPPPLDDWGKTVDRTARAGRRANRDRAIVLLHETAAAWPTDAEAFLRLALLLSEDGRFADAHSALGRAAPLEKPPILRYHETLTRARLAEGQGRTEDAVAAYLLATSIAPGAQTPLLALARLQFVAGRADAVRKALLGALPRTSPSDTADPRWQLIFGQTWRRGEYLQRLDGMVRQCGS